MSYPPPPPPGHEPPPSGSGENPPPAGGAGGYPPPPPGGGGGYPAPPAGGGGYAQPQTSQKALWSLIVGIVSSVVALCCGFFGLPLGIAGIVAIFLGNSGKKDIRASGGQQTGEGMAKAGVILGIVAIVLAVLATVWLIYLISVGEGLNTDYNFDSNSG